MIEFIVEVSDESEDSHFASALKRQIGFAIEPGDETQSAV